jgi:hypothetical protein
MSTFTAHPLDDAGVPTSPRPAMAPVPPAKDGMSIRRIIAICAFVALLAGGIGALISAAAFPAHNGKAGSRGPTGPAGSAASVANVSVDTNKVGYCFTTNTGNDNLGNSFITSVDLFPPTDSNGALSCSVGQFVSLTPYSPQGGPVSNYNAMAPPAGTSTSGPTSAAASSSTTASTGS